MKMQVFRLCCVVLTTVWCLAGSAAIAGKISGQRSGLSSSRGFAVKAASRPAPSGPVNYGRFTPRTSAPSDLPASGNASRGYTSVLDRSTTRPSEKLQTVIREKESHGPGWVGTGLLVWLLSQHDLSSSDRAWIQQQINDTREKKAETSPLPEPELSDVVFNWTYPPVFHAGEKADIVVTAAMGMAQKPVPVSCTLNDVHSDSTGNSANLAWNPAHDMAAVMCCEADGLSDMRLFSTEGMNSH
ncbi:hypothetical protein ACI2I2_19975 [Scandinavium sp. NPDC088450]|uniref:hypothetical protein n=1 Tax=Scandinavium sp. NPDC088450 TaxID=3364514 RepID=UPI00384DFD12